MEKHIKGGLQTKWKYRLCCPKCGSCDTRGDYDGSRICFKCLNRWNPLEL